MSFPALNLLLPAILAVHNLDEYCQYDNFVREFYGRLPKKLTTRRVFGGTAVLLTLVVLLLSALTYSLRSGTLVMISRVAMFALMLNGIGHCVLSLKRRTWVPGTLSAITLILPYSVVAILATYSSGNSFLSLFRYAALSAITAPLVITACLFISYGFSRWAAHAGKRWRSWLG